MGLNHEDTKTRSKYKPYPTYKDSGVEWLGDVPEHWNIVKSKYLFQKQQRLVREHDGIVTAFRDGEVTLRSNRRTQGFTNALKEYGYQGIRIGDLVIHAMDAFAGAIGVSDSEGKSTPVYSVCKPHSHVDINTKYYGKLLRTMSQRGYIEALAKGIRERSTEFRFNDFSRLELPLPSHAEQTAIVNFLDQETGKMDLLIEKQQTMIALLKEKRQAVISHAVTKGIPNQNRPNTKMKDLGIKLLGQIPEDWGVIPLRHLGFLQNGISKGGDYFGSGFPFLNYGDVYKNDLLPTNVSGLANSNEYDQLLYSVKRGDIFFTRTSETVDEIGIASTCLKTIDKAIFSGFTIRFRPSGNSILPEFSRYYFRSGISTIFFVKEMNLVTRASLGQDLLKRLPVIIPPINEQSKIVLYLDDKTKKIDTLIEKSQQAIALLKERKTALISAAVTGKIDVRGVA